jgi:anaerobic ribonucleoside-triphosphate reductase activating protein
MTTAIQEAAVVASHVIRNAVNVEVRVASIILHSEVNGPGKRNVIHFQGCTLGCPGCFNPHTHPDGGGELWEVSRLLKYTQQEAHSKGYTISGGEPFQQPEALRTLVDLAPKYGVESIIVFTGYTPMELAAQKVSLEGIDVLVAGRYNRAKPHYTGLVASSNQEVMFLTGRYSPKDFSVTNDAEVQIDVDGSVVITGFPDPVLLDSLKNVEGT